MHAGDARDLTDHLLGDLHPHMEHVRGVGLLAEQMWDCGRLTDRFVLLAAWLHDIGHSPAIARTGFPALDGAAYLSGHGVEPRVVSLVAHHGLAWAEAAQRGLEAELSAFPAPDAGAVATLTFLDLSTGPQGERVTPEEHIEGLLERHGPDEPVHRALRVGATSLLLQCSIARDLLELPASWAARRDAS